MYSLVEAERYLATRRGLPWLVPVLRRTGLVVRLPRRGVRGLADVATGVGADRDDDDVCAWLARQDGPGLRRAVAAHVRPSAAAATLRLLLRARRHPDVDPDGAFRSQVTREGSALLERWPVLWEYPVRFTRWLAALPSSSSSSAWLDFAERVVQGRLSDRLVSRTRRAVAARVITLGNVLQGDAADAWPATSAEGLRRVVAVAVARMQRRHDDAPRGRRLRAPQQGGGSVLESWLQFFRGVLRRGGVFPWEYHAGDLTRRDILRRMRILEQEDPERYRAMPKNDGVLRRNHGEGNEHTYAHPDWRFLSLTLSLCVANPPLTSMDVDRLLAAAATPGERAFVLLCASTGLRAEAIARLTVGDVVDPTGSAIADHAVVLEKNSRARCLPLPAGCPLREELARWLLPLTQPRATPLFGCIGSGAGVATTWLRRLCARAGISGRRNPHQFRALLVDSAMAAGSALSDVAQYLGHRSVETTMRHYWSAAPTTTTPTPPQRGDAADGDDSDRVLVQWEAERLLELEELWRQLTGGADATHHQTRDE